MRELGLAGLVAIVFGLGSFYATRHFGVFNIVNLGGGTLALLVAAVGGARRLRSVGGPHSRGVIGRGLLWIVAALALGIGLVRVAEISGARFDWTFEQSYALSDGLLSLLADTKKPVTATLFYDPDDPRVRSTRLLLDTIQRESGGMFVRKTRILDESPEEADRFGVGSSNTVVLEQGSHWETVPRPNEGTIYEGLHLLDRQRYGRLLILRGEGEGDPQRDDDLGFAGLATALDVEGYRVDSRVTAALDEVPDDVDAVLAIAPRRRLLPRAVDALRRYVERGGSLVVMLEPGTDTGIEELLTEYGITPEPGLVVDPASGPVLESSAEGVNVIAFNYEVTDLTRGLGPNRMTFFPGVRALALRLPRPEDTVSQQVLSSHRAWISDDLSWLERHTGRPEIDGHQPGYQVLVASGRYPRKGGEARIVVFGDSDFASNRYLRALYNLDLAMNSIHWSTQRELAITTRPKIRQTVQFPMPLNDTVKAFYGVGLLLPELLLIAGGITWLRRRSA